MIRLFVVLLVVLLSPVLVQAQGGGLQQKMELVDRLLKDSDTSRRVSAKGDTATRALLDQAKQAREEARQALSAGDEKKGSALLDQSLKLVTKAARNSADPASRQWLLRSRHEDLVVSVGNFRDAYLRHLQRLKQGEKGPLSVAQVDQLRQQGIALGKENKFAEANKLLQQANGMVVEGLKSLLGSTALVYELKFDTPKDEYDYEVKRGESYEAMIRMVLSEGGQKNTDEAEFQPLMDKSQEYNRQASDQAASGQYKTAIKTQEEANKFLGQILRKLGVMIPL